MVEARGRARPGPRPAQTQGRQPGPHRPGAESDQEGENVAAAIFWMKARAGWREKQPAALALEDKSPEEMTDEELEDIIRKSRKDDTLPKVSITIVNPDGATRPFIDG